jgi:hypothetical protein
MPEQHDEQAVFDGRHDARPNDPIDPLALALFGVRDHVRHHTGCLEKRGVGGHHFDADDECALADIVRRYGDVRATEPRLRLASTDGSER